jgi:hypothetical protein
VHWARWESTASCMLLIIRVSHFRMSLIVDEDFEPGAVWFDGLTDTDVPEKDRIAIARGNAIKLFKLEKLLGSK